MKLLMYSGRLRDRLAEEYKDTAAAELDSRLIEMDTGKTGEVCCFCLTAAAHVLCQTPHTSPTFNPPRRLVWTRSSDERLPSNLICLPEHAASKNKYK